MPRKITTQAVSKFLEGKNFKSGDTSVETSLGEVLYKLHGHTIARRTENKLSVSLCGWNTTTTRERLNGLPGVSINTKKGQAFLNGNPITDDGTYAV